MNRLRRLPTILTGVLALLIAWIEKRNPKGSSTTVERGTASPSDRAESTGASRSEGTARSDSPTEQSSSAQASTVETAASLIPSTPAVDTNVASERASNAGENKRGALDTTGVTDDATDEASRTERTSPEEDTSERIDDAVSDESAEFIEDAWGPDDDGSDGVTPTASTTEPGRVADGVAATMPAGAVAGDGTADCPADHPIKGNASSRIYHEPGRSSYARTIPEFCFATPEDAEAAGYRAPQR